VVSITLDFVSVPKSKMNVASRMLLDKQDAKAHVIIIVANSHFQAAAQAAQMLG
jgi:predicted nucleotidyltransferase